MARIKIETIAEELAPDKWQVLSTEYQNLDTEMEFICAEGHKVYAPWKRIRTKRECPVCKQNQFKLNQNVIKPKVKGENRVLALDQASRITGYSIFDGNTLVHYGTFEAIDEEEGKRCHEVRIWLMSMIENWQCDLIGIEGIQFQEKMGVTTFQTLARLQGILIDLCIELNIPYVICPTNTWRAHCGVKGRARADKKRSMQLLVKEWYDVSVSDDIADAVGIGKYVSDTHQKKTKIVNWE